MIVRYTKEYSESLVSGYIQDIECQRDLIIKNFQDMDFTNANIRREFEAIVNDIIRNCNRLIDEIESLSNFE